MAHSPYSDQFYAQAMKLIGSLSEILMARGMMLGLAESCTGGLMASLCTEVPGSSAWFSGGVVSYSNEVKRSLLGVDEELLLQHGAVSAQVAEKMAQGVLPATNAHVGVAITGIAGPGGGTEQKPVGTVWIGMALLEPAKLGSRRYLFPGSRREIRAASVLHALEGACRLLLEAARPETSTMQGTAI